MILHTHVLVGYLKNASSPSPLYTTISSLAGNLTLDFSYVWVFSTFCSEETELREGLEKRAYKKAGSEYPVPILPLYLRFPWSVFHSSQAY